MICWSPLGLGLSPPTNQPTIVTLYMARNAINWSLKMIRMNIWFCVETDQFKLSQQSSKANNWQSWVKWWKYFQAWKYFSHKINVESSVFCLYQSQFCNLISAPTFCNGHFSELCICLSAVKHGREGREGMLETRLAVVRLAVLAVRWLNPSSVGCVLLAVASTAAVWGASSLRTLVSDPSSADNCQHHLSEFLP